MGSKSLVLGAQIGLSPKINLGSGAGGAPSRGTSAAKQTEGGERWRGWETLEILLAPYTTRCRPCPRASRGTGQLLQDKFRGYPTKAGVPRQEHRCSSWRNYRLRGRAGTLEVPVPSYLWVCLSSSSTRQPQNRAAPRESWSSNFHSSSCTSNHGPCSALALHIATFWGTTLPCK